MEAKESAASAASTGRGRTAKGKTTIADSVVSAIAGIATRETSGVYAMGGGASRALGAMRDRVSGSDDPARGVKVEVGERQTAIDLEIVVEYGSQIDKTANSIRSNVSGAVETMTGLDVVETNVSVLDVHLPGADEEEESSSDGSRVQ